MAQIDGFDSPREHYIQTDLSARAVAQKWSALPGCSESALYRHSTREDWKRLREDYRENLREKTAEKRAENIADEEEGVRRECHRVANR